eukprot:TRINITY_DN7677_c0_g1_i7.p1 TRINITY_DN7677_c0_g1~~TRINITY_DN7677_c0_g1_i7.p1  ORF type:complete len:1018 (-),score=198.41 TRINITY_DN7677_c0_g1_i7:907-3597(-)
MTKTEWDHAKHTVAESIRRVISVAQTCGEPARKFITLEVRQEEEEEEETESTLTASFAQISKTLLISLHNLGEEVEEQNITKFKQTFKTFVESLRQWQMIFDQVPALESCSKDVHRVVGDCKKMLTYSTTAFSDENSKRQFLQERDSIRSEIRQILVSAYKLLQKGQDDSDDDSSGEEVPLTSLTDGDGSVGTSKDDVSKRTIKSPKSTRKKRKTSKYKSSTRGHGEKRDKGEKFGQEATISEEKEGKEDSLRNRNRPKSVLFSNSEKQKFAERLIEVLKENEPSFSECYNRKSPEEKLSLTKLLLTEISIFEKTLTSGGLQSNAPSSVPITASSRKSLFRTSSVIGGILLAEEEGSEIKTVAKTVLADSCSLSMSESISTSLESGSTGFISPQTGISTPRTATPSTNLSISSSVEESSTSELLSTSSTPSTALASTVVVGTQPITAMAVAGSLASLGSLAAMTPTIGSSFPNIKKNSKKQRRSGVDEELVAELSDYTQLNGLDRTSMRLRGTRFSKKVSKLKVLPLGDITGNKLSTECLKLVLHVLSILDTFIKNPGPVPNLNKALYHFSEIIRNEFDRIINLLNPAFSVEETGLCKALLRSSDLVSQTKKLSGKIIELDTKYLQVGNYSRYVQHFLLGSCYQRVYSLYFNTSQLITDLAQLTICEEYSPIVLHFCALLHTFYEVLQSLADDLETLFYLREYDTNQVKEKNPPSLDANDIGKTVWDFKDVFVLDLLYEPALLPELILRWTPVNSVPVSEFVSTFLYTWSQFTTASSIIDHMICRWNCPTTKPKEQVNLIHTRVLKALSDWIPWGYYHIDNVLKEKIQTFLISTLQQIGETPLKKSVSNACDALEKLEFHLRFLSVERNRFPCGKDNLHILSSSSLKRRRLQNTSA